MKPAQRHFCSCLIALAFASLFYCLSGFLSATAAAQDVLSRDERLWLEKHSGALTIVTAVHWAPYDYFDEQGNFSGYVADYIELLQNKLNVRFTIVRTKNWLESLDQAKSHQADMITSITSAAERGPYLNFAGPFRILPISIIAANTEKETLNLANLGGRKVGMVAGYFMEPAIRTQYPKVILVPLENESAGVRLVSLGGIDAFISDVGSVTYFAERDGIKNLRVAGGTDFKFDLHIGVRNDWPILRDILQKGMNEISPAENDRIYRKWIHLEQKSIWETNEFWLIVLGTTGLVMLIAGLAVFWNRSLQKQVAVQTQTLQQELVERRRLHQLLTDNEERYRAVVEQAPEAILLSDPDTAEIVEANSRFTTLLGYDLRREPSLTMFDIIIESPANIREMLAEIQITGFLPAERCELRHKNGTVVNVERSATLVRYGKRNLLVQTLHDVSDEMRREQELCREAQMATRVQKALLPVLEPSDYLSIAAVYEPYGFVGGDLYFLDWRYGDNLLRGFLIDAVGHGLGTALHTASLHVLLRELNERDLPLSDAMRWLNRRAGDYFDEATFAGAMGFEFDLDIRKLRWVCAGIPKIWMATKTQQGVFECPGMCLGIRDDETFETHTVAVDIGDSFFFLTDGLGNLLESRTDLPLDRFPAMVDLLRNLSESEGRRDDATAVCIHVNALPQSLVRQDGWPRIIRFNGYGDYQRLKGEVAKILAEVMGLPHSLQEVAVHEALANAMECRDGVPRQHKARLRFNKVGNRLIVRVKTSRMGFAGNAILRRLRSQPEDMFSFGEDASMGRGIPMMLSMSHKMTYNSEGTEVLLAWKL